MKLQLFYRTIITDSKGKIVKRSRWRKSRSFVIAFLQHIELFTSHAFGADITLSLKNTSNTAKTLPALTTIWYNLFTVFAGDNDSSYGIVVGSGTTAPTNADYALGTQIVHGVGAGQLDYGAHSRTTTAVVGANVDYVISRTFYNGSGATITVKEIGIYCASRDLDATTQVFCIVRDVLAASQDVLNTQTLTVQYTLRTTV